MRRGLYLLLALFSLCAGAEEFSFDAAEFDKKTFLPVDIECLAASGMLIKTLHFKDIQDFGGGIRRPATVETDSPLYKGYKSVMLYAQIKKREFADEVFTLNYLPRVEGMRK